MRFLIAFLKKELLEHVRQGKLLILGIIFVMLGIMNPATAKLTPWLLEMMSESLAESGMNITVTTVTAMDSWVQFFKNIPMGLIAFVLIEGTVFTKEYNKGTLVLSLTKGLQRNKVVVAKAFMLLSLWTVAYFACYFITYAYNAYYWDNSVAENLFLSAICWWLFGIFTVSLTVLFSTLVNSGTAVLGLTGGVVMTFYLISIIPKVGKYLPTQLMDGNSLIFATSKPQSYIAAIIITAILSIVCLTLSIPIFNKKQM